MIDMRIVRFAYISIMLIISSFFFVNLYFNDPEHVEKKRNELEGNYTLYRYLYILLIIIIVLSFFYVINNLLEEININASNVDRNINIILTVSGVWVTAILYLLIMKHLYPETKYEKNYLDSFLNISTFVNLLGAFVFIYRFLYPFKENSETNINLDTFSIIFFFTAGIFYTMIPIYNTNICPTNTLNNNDDTQGETLLETSPDEPELEYFNLWNYISKIINRDEKINSEINNKEKLLDIIDKYCVENKTTTEECNKMKLYVNKYPNFEDGNFIGAGNEIDEKQLEENFTLELIKDVILDHANQFDKHTKLYSWKASIVVSLLSSFVITIKNYKKIIFLI